MKSELLDAEGSGGYTSWLLQANRHGKQERWREC